MKKIFAAVIAVILVVSALCVVSSAVIVDYSDAPVEDSGITLHVGDVVVFYDDFVYYDKHYYDLNKDHEPESDPFEGLSAIPSDYWNLPAYDILVGSEYGDDKEHVEASDCISIIEVAAGNCYVVTCLSSGTFVVCSSVNDDDSGEDALPVKYTVTIAETASGSFIASFLSGLTEIFAGLVKGFAGVSVNAADSLILTSDGSLTSFAQLGICGIGLALVAGVVGLLARRFRR